MKKELEKQFIGIGEVKGFKFTRIMYTEHVNLYKVESNEGNIHFEVFKRKFTPVCIDFENRVYSDTEFKENYPKAKDFGKWAWCINDYKKAENKYNELIHE
jgi:hypothetical protein